MTFLLRFQRNPMRAELTTGISERDDQSEAARPDSVSQSPVLDVLVTEHQRVSTYSDGLLSMIVQIIGIAYAAIAGLAVIVSTSDISLSAPVYWLLPFVTVLVFAMILLLLARIIFASYYLRDLESRIQKMTDIGSYQFEYAAVRGLHSIRTGNRSHHASYVLLFASAAALHIVLLYFCWDQLRRHDPPPWQLSAFIGLQSAMALSLIILLVGTLFTIRSSYYRWMPPLDLAANDGIDWRKGLSLIWYVLIPAKFALIWKGLITLSLFVATALILNFDIRSTQVWCVFLLAFVAVELGAKQTSYLWNDIIDFYDDRTHPRKSRHKLCMYGTRDQGKVAFFLRSSFTWLVTATAAYLQPELRWWLIALIFVIFALQLVYDQFAKRTDWSRLIFASLVYAERAFAGAAVVLSLSSWRDWPFAVLACTWTVAYALLFLSSFWHAEFVELKISSAWMVGYAVRLQILGASTMVAIGVAISRLYSDQKLFSSNEASLVLLVTGIGLVLITYSIYVRFNVSRRPRVRQITLLALILMGVGTYLVDPLHFGYLLLVTVIPATLFASQFRLTYQDYVYMQYEVLADILQRLYWSVNYIYTRPFEKPSYGRSS